MGDGVDVGRLGAECLDRARLGRPHGEGVEGEVVHGVAVRDPVDHVVVQGGEERLVDLGCVGPCAVGVRVVGFPADIVDVEVVEQADAHRVVDEAAQHAVAEDGGRPVTLGELVLGPARVLLLDVFGPLEEVGIQPMSPSVREKRRSGKRHQKSAHMRSPRE